MLPLARPARCKQMEVRQTIRVTIVDDSQGVKCDALCGVDWSSTEAVALATERIKDRFGDRVQLEYLDLAKPIASHHALELSQQVRDKDLSLPLLAIDGKPRISGQFDIRQLVNAIEVEVEIRQ